MKTAGPIIDPLASPQNEVEEFLIRLAIAHADLDEQISKAMIPRVEHGGFMVMPRSFWNPGRGTVYG
jgi:hypothetical protein